VLASWLIVALTSWYSAGCGQAGELEPFSKRAGTAAPDQPLPGTAGRGGCAPSACSSVTALDLVPDLPPSEEFHVSVSGIEVPVRRYNRVGLASFAFAGEVDVEIRSSRAANLQLSPKSLGLQPLSSAEAVRFTMRQPYDLVVFTPDQELERLVLLSALSEPEPSDALDVTELGVSNASSSEQTQSLQAALVRAAEQGRTLYFPPGIYRTAQLDVPGNTDLYLAPGAVLRAREAENPSYGLGILTLREVSNVVIRGGGVIDGRGSLFRPLDADYSMIEIESSSNVAISGITLLDSEKENVAIKRSSGVSLQGIGVVADLEPAFHTPAYLVLSSQDVQIGDAFYYGNSFFCGIGGDRSGALVDTLDLTIQDATIWTDPSSIVLQIGSGLDQDRVERITFENADVIRGGTLSSIFVYGTANVQEVAFKNVRAELLRQPFSWGLGSEPAQRGYLRNVMIQSVDIEHSEEPSYIQATDAERDVRARFADFRIAGELVTAAEASRFALQGESFMDLSFTSARAPFVSVSASSASLNAACAAGGFVFERTGDAAGPLAVPYRWLGAAASGLGFSTDLQERVTFASGQSLVSLLVVPVLDGANEGSESLGVELISERTGLTWQVGRRSRAQLVLCDAGP
jgi:hypothetical protein